LNWTVAAISSLIVTALAIIVLRPVAVTLNLIDKPGGRKLHHGEIPIIGGLAMYIGLSVGLGLLTAPNIPLGSLTAAFGMLVLVGLFDDRFSLSPWVRLPIHAAVALFLLTYADCRVLTLGDAFGLGDIHIAGAWVYLATIVLIAAAINAFNMLDGLDGLAGTTAGVALAALGFAAWQQGDMATLSVCAVLLGAICGFLLFNLPVSNYRPLRCFMGDSGSTLLGMAVSWAMIRLSQGQTADHAGINPVTALWIGGLPLIELVWSFIRRISRRRSPFVGDAEHFHHLLLSAGFSVRGAYVVLLLLATVLAACGMTLQYAGISEYVSLSLLAVTGVLVVRSMYRLTWLLDHVPQQMRRSSAERR
jgi:UDP-GlcNAc:undecaprenyl-phosphate/decaprenyl-phosphate GlcNAc-1-phosphate transferase